jgi:hypothetical protein
VEDLKDVHISRAARMCPRMPPVLIEPERFQIPLFITLSQAKPASAFAKKALWRRSKGEAVASDGSSRTKP